MKKLEDYIHLYIGCKCTYPDTDPEAPWIVATLTGCTIADGVETTYLEVQKTSHGETHGDYLSWKSNGHHNSDALHLKLILRPLESMTNDEVEEYAKLGDLDHNKMVSESDPFRVDKMAAMQGHWLFKNGFDVYDLITAGLAEKREG